MKTRFAATAAIALTALLTLSGCANAATESGQGANPSPTDSASFADANNADVMFTAMMIPHHEQAVEMADMVLVKEGIDERVVTLAQEIKAAQGPEIELMTSWLDGWGVDAADGMGGMDHGDGMMSGSDMSELDAANGDDASRLFLEQMIVHHEGAIEMAETEIDEGQNADAVALAQEIIDAQAAEITIMQDIISSL
ncbi:DUF305 domain-containing protein [Salinibacterium sp. M195]|uniref:DUF305 domain-containing protein n=1 Tax=Salinibacterium sp. M195 TaxID=2583374 RepID=UPI001C62E8E2|nr:DUF305 domain-containing protein [Salinibacterium sp. M195]QYH35017.1 DUF305 domain-containing protein [Salinibacterium sp. M195]